MTDIFSADELGFSRKLPLLHGRMASLRPCALSSLVFTLTGVERSGSPSFDPPISKLPSVRPKDDLINPPVNKNEK